MYFYGAAADNMTEGGDVICIVEMFGSYVFDKQ